MLRLSFTGRKFVFRCNFDSREIARRAGFKFDPGRRLWYTDSVRDAFKLREYADSTAERRFESLSIRVSPWQESVPYPFDKKPYPYQIESAYFSLSRNSSYQGLAPRLGKTVVSALIINALDTPTVFITPPFLTRTIEAELRGWTTRKPRIVRYDPKEAPLEEPEILIVPDSLIARESVRNEIFDFAYSALNLGIEPTLIVDEAHRYKSPDAERTRSLLGVKGATGIIRAFPRKIFLSGTPMLNRPIELHPLLARVAPATIDFMTREEYGFKFCAGKQAEEICSVCHGTKAVMRKTGRVVCSYCRGRGKFENGLDFSGASNLPELQKRLYGTFMNRIKTVEGLPPRVEEMVIIGEKPPKLLKLEAKLLAEHSPEDLVSGTVRSDSVATYRKELGKLKIAPAVDFLRCLLDDSEESILVFAFHREVVSKIAERLARFKPLVIQGGVSNAERERIQKTFQADKSHRLVVANYVAAGLGLRLSRADRVVMVEFSWTPSENDQAADRANAVNSGKEELFVQYLVFENSIDRKTIEVNLRKRNVTSYI